jgi:KDO2-lipid IV(A) lauroyltransferase
MKIPFKKARYLFGGVVFALVEFVIPKTPLSLIHLLSDILFFATYPILSRVPSYRKIVFGNLKIAFDGSYNKREIRRIARESIRNIFRMPFDIVYYGHPRNHDKLKRDIRISGAEHIEAALREGRGVVGIGAHMVDFLLLTVRLSQSDLPFIVPTKIPKNELLNRKYKEWWQKSKVTYIDVDEGDRAREKMVAAIEKNQIVYLISDERKKRNGILVPFFGKPALTAQGPAMLSIKTGAPIIPIFINHENGLIIDILPPLDSKRTGNTESDIYNITYNVNCAICDYIKKYPGQWFWINPRWRP